MSTIPLPLAGASAMLLTVAPEHVLPALVSADVARRQWTISAGQSVLRWTLRVPADLARATTLLGSAHELAGQPLTLHLLLALLTRGANIDSGTAAAAGMLASSLGHEHIVANVDANALASDAAIRAAVQAVLEQGMPLRAEGRWNLARTLVEMSITLWRTRGPAARLFALAERYSERDLILSCMAALAVPLISPSLPLPLSERLQAETPQAACAARMDAWLDWISCAPGPDPLPSPLLPDGLGLDGQALPENRNEELSLPRERAELLHSVARSLLRETAHRPAPRYLHQLLRVTIPRRLRTLLLPWHVTGMRVIPHMQGMYVAVEAGSSPQPAAVAWWPADDSYQLKAPKAFPPALWLLIHVIAAAFWRDLHAAAVIVEAAPAAPHGAASPGRPKRRERGVRTVVLPPARRTRSDNPPVEHLARWSTPEEEVAISFFTQQGARYRALPHGWEEREQHTDFQRRRRQATERAQIEGYPEPEPGFTFVRSHERVTHGAPSRVAVISRGLLRAVLGLEVPLDQTGEEP